MGLGYRSKLLVQLAISRGLIELLLVGDVVRGLQRILLNGGVLSLVGRLEQHLLVLLLESLELLLLLQYDVVDGRVEPVRIFHFRLAAVAFLL